MLAMFFMVFRCYNDVVYVDVTGVQSSSDVVHEALEGLGIQEVESHNLELK